MHSVHVLLWFVVVNSLRPSDAYMHINIASGNGLSPIPRQAIILTSAAILLIRPQGTYFSEILFKIQKFSFKEMHLKMWSAKVAAILTGLNMLNEWNEWMKCMAFYTQYFQIRKIIWKYCV